MVGVKKTIKYPLLALILIVVCVGVGIVWLYYSWLHSSASGVSGSGKEGQLIIKRINGPFKYSHPYMIISSDGTRALLDPYKIPEGVDADIVTVSHSHSDHVDEEFLKRTKAKVSYMTNESFSVGNIKVTGIPSDHNSNVVDTKYPDNLIYLYEVDGLRIAHFGDCGQDALTDEQLKALGKIDVAIMIFLDYPQTENSIENSIKLMEQIKPKIILSHEYSQKGLIKIGEIVGRFEKLDNELILNKAELERSKRKVIELNYNPR